MVNVNQLSEHKASALIQCTYHTFVHRRMGEQTSGDDECIQGRKKNREGTCRQSSEASMGEMEG